MGHALVEGFSSAKEFERLSDYEREAAEAIVLEPGAKQASVSHLRLTPTTLAPAVLMPMCSTRLSPCARTVPARHVPT